MNVCINIELCDGEVWDGGWHEERWRVEGGGGGGGGVTTSVSVLVLDNNYTEMRQWDSLDERSENVDMLMIRHHCCCWL